ncbi:MAG TPA: phage holin family protein [Stellaceae bacterium]|nr:phage holin family protein [Stellaceae bacterium]
MADQDTASPREPGLAALLARLFQESETLLLQQLALLRAEMGENAGRLIGGVTVLLAGAAVLLIGGCALVAAAILLLGRLLPFWAAAAVVGLAVAALGAALMLYGRRLVARASLVPRQSWQVMRETGDWLREELT